VLFRGNEDARNDYWHRHRALVWVRAETPRLALA
jgi:hypothetical protein